MRRPSYQRVSKLLRYEPKTGKFYWRESRGRVRKGQVAGQAAGTKSAPHIKIDRRVIYAHHIAVLFMTGAWPKTLMGFRDYDSTNCRWRNLRPTTIRRQRTHNRTQRNNTSGYRGVGFNLRKRKWFARIRVNKRQIFLGYHDKRSEAATARRRAAKRYGYRF